MIWQMYEVNWWFNWDMLLLLYLKLICEAVQFRSLIYAPLTVVNPVRSDLDSLTSGICFKIYSFY